jgi:amino acid adenylation domain-containing protein
VSRGYLERPEITGERFVTDPFAGNPGARMYRTGDLGRWLPDGTIEFLGRNDFQVKVRGYRIELEEIEARLAEHAGVREAVVIAREDTAGDKRLVAYYTGAEEESCGAVGAEELRRHVAAKLPEYMAPAAYVRLDRLPLTPSGKLDRKALPEPERDAFVTRGYEAPVGEIESMLAGIYADVLKVERVGRRDNFFELGGHSLLVLRLIERLRRAGFDVDVRALFATPVLAELAAAIRPRSDTVQVPANRIPSGCQAITPDMLPLVQLTVEEIEQIVSGVPGGAANVHDIYPLAPLQEGILFHHLMDRERDPYVGEGLYSFESRGRLEAYLEAMQAVIDRHDILRTSIMWEGLSEPVQVVWRKATLPVEEAELGLGDAAQQLYARYSPPHHRIDVRQAPLLRVVIAQDSENGRWLMMKLRHHLSGDHFTSEAVYEEIHAHLLGEADRLPAPLPFRNLVAQARLGISREEHETFFRQLLGDVEEPTAPFGLLNVQGDGRGIEQSRIKVETGVARRIREGARKLGVSAASLCHLAWAQVVGRVSGREDVVFGTVLFGRMQGGEGAGRAMGLFMNTLPVRIGVGAEGAESSVRRTHKLLSELLRHEHASLALAQRCSAVPAPTPLFSALLNYRHSAGAEARSEESARAWEGIESLQGENRTNYPLSLDVDDLGESFWLTVQVEASIEAKRVCQYMHQALESLVEALESEPDRPMRTLEVLPKEERQQVLYEWNATEEEYPSDKCIHELFEEQVEKTPEAVAVVFEDALLTYAELNRRANQLAHYLRGLGVGTDALVAICMERNLEMVVGMLGVLKAGAAYVALDPSYPAERVRFMLKDSGPVALLTQGRLQGLFSGISESLPVLDLEDPAAPWRNKPETNLGIGGSAQDLAYVIYTSGSTGLPKAAMVEHGGKVNHLDIMVRDLKLTAEDMVAQTASQCFDISVWQFLAALLVGGRVLIVGEKETHDPESLLRVLGSRGVTIFETVPAMLEAMIGEESEISVRLESLRWVLVCGEAWTAELCRRWMSLHPDIPLMNAYGPAECSDDVTFCAFQEWPAEEMNNVPIGKPLSNTQIYVLDGQGEPAPVGVSGELCVGGDCVGRGYLNRAEMTAERFVGDAFANKLGARMYRSGDLGKWNRNQELEFLGRVDHQVKVRGFRIEPGEIEARLAEQADVREAVVVAREDTVGDKRLVAYYTTVDGNGGGAEELRTYLAARLPEYMVPAAYVRLERLPLTPNGKLDRKALPAPNGNAYVMRGYASPIGETETVLASIWAEVLKVERVGRHDNFFELGGHSLLVVRVISRLRKHLNVEVSISDLFVRPILASFAEHVINLQLEQFDPDKLADVLNLMRDSYIK